MAQEKVSKEKILEIAREEFQEKGESGVRMQSIADRAGVNKALIHYYFKNKDGLFQEVFKETAQKSIFPIIKILGEDAPLREKIERFVSGYIDFLSANPNIITFVLGELKQHQNLNLKKDMLKVVFSSLGKQLNELHKRGEIIDIPVGHFFSSMMGMIITPFIAKPIIEGALGLDENAYQHFIKERKKLVPMLIMNSIKQS